MLFADVTPAPIPALWSSDWWSTFLTSPAFAGVAAIVAAGIATIGVSRQVKASRDAATAAQGATDKAAVAAEKAAILTRENAVEDRDRAAWWAQYQWLESRLPAEAPADAVLVLNSLAAVAPDPVASVVVGVASKRYQETEQPTGGDTHDGGSSSGS